MARIRPDPPPVRTSFAIPGVHGGERRRPPLGEFPPAGSLVQEDRAGIGNPLQPDPGDALVLLELLQFVGAPEDLLDRHRVHALRKR